MTTDDNKSAENLETAAAAMAPLGLMAAEPVAAAPAAKKRKAETPGARPLTKRKYEQMAQLVAYEQLTFAEAYAKVYGGEATLVRSNAARLKREHPEIVERVAFLDREVKEEAMLHRGTTFASAVNKLNDVMETMYRKRSDPKAASVMISAAGLILKATGQDGQAGSIEERIEEERTSEILPGIQASLRRVITRRRSDDA